MSSVASNSTTREVLDRLLAMDEPAVDRMLQAAREAFAEFSRVSNGRHHGGNMDYFRGAWHQAVRSLLDEGQIKEPSLEVDLLALAQELRDYFTHDK